MLISILILLLLLISVIGLGLCFFLAHRLSFYFSLSSPKALFAFFLWFFTLVCAGAFGFVHTKNSIAIVIHWITSIALGFYLNLIICTLIFELIRRIVKLNNKTLGIALLSVTTLLSAYGFYNAYQLVVTERTIEIKGLSQPIKAVHVTDTHIGQFRSRKNLQDVVNVINKINPDIVFHTGDLLDSRVHLDDNILAPLADIKAPVIFVHGNHDMDTGMLEIGHELRKLPNLYYLNNKIMEWQGIQIVGLDYMRPDRSSPYLKKMNRPTVNRVLEQMQLDTSRPIILLHHGPYGTKYAQKKGVDLYLAGHTHGGQIFPFNFLNVYIFEFNAGLFDLDGMKVHIPYGVGTYGPPMRIGTKSEMAILNLVPKS